jgi:cytochrome P450 family 6
VVGNVAFGIDCNCLENPDSKFRKYGKRLFDITAFEFLKFFFSSSMPELSRKLKMLSNPKECSDFFMATFMETIEQRRRENIIRNDFVHLLLQMQKDTDGKIFTDVELAAESFLFYAGGFETSSTLMTFCLYELALNKDIQERLRNETNDNLESNGQITYNVLHEMKYLDMVINGEKMK